MIYDPALDDLAQESRDMNELVASFMEAMPGTFTPEALTERRTTNLMPGADPLDHAEIRSIEGPAGPIDLRILRPDTIDGVYLQIHGGGWAIGAAHFADSANWALAQAASVATVSVEYRLAPEHPFPAGPDDCLAAARWLIANAADEFGTTRLIIGGDSSGAHLAALTLLGLRDAGGAEATEFRAANLVFGAYDLSMTPSQRASHESLVIPHALLEEFYEMAMPGAGADERRDPDISPLYADLTGLPPALFTVGTLDPLLDDSLFMAARWQAAGNPTELAVYPESIHGFVAFPIEMASVANERIARFVGDHVRGD